MLTENLMKLTLASGSEWVMYILICLSVISLSIIAERAFFFRKKLNRLFQLDHSLSPMITDLDRKGISNIVQSSDESTLQAAMKIGHNYPADAIDKMIDISLTRERLSLERYLGFLGTLGNNAPFIGLFGTVLGIIRAIYDLSQKQGQAVMIGISEALVATAIGLFVAIPAVLAYNHFQKQVDKALSITEVLAHGIVVGVLEDTRSSIGQRESA